MCVKCLICRTLFFPLPSLPSLPQHIHIRKCKTCELTGLCLLRNCSKLCFSELEEEIHSSIYPITQKYLQSTYSVPGTEPGSGGTVMDNIGHSSVRNDVTFLCRECHLRKGRCSEGSKADARKNFPAAVRGCGQMTGRL